MAFISEIKFRGGSGASNEYIEVTLAPGDDPADITISVYDDTGALHTTSGISGGEVTLDTLTGTPHPDDPSYTVYQIPVGLRNAQSNTNEGSGIALTDTSTATVEDFYSADNLPPITATEGAASGATSDNILEHTAIQPQESYQFDINGTVTLGPVTENTSVICLTSGGRVLTDRGRRPAGTLRLGDRVWTADRGLQPIRWIGQRRVTAAEMARHPGLRPVRFRKGSLGDGVPSRGLTVSRQHRVMIAAPSGAGTVLVAAHRLIAVPGVGFRRGARDVTYVHLLLDHHAILDCDGTPVESLFLTAYASGLAPGAGAAVPYHSDPARPLVEGPAARALVAQALARGGPLVIWPPAQTVARAA